MTAFANFSSIQSPSVNVIEGDVGVPILELIPHTWIYLFLTAPSSVPAQTLVPTLISSVTDFENVYSLDSPSYRHVQQIFRNDPFANLYCVRVAARPEVSITVSSVPTTPQTLTIEGRSFTIEPLVGDTVEAIASRLSATIQTSHPTVTSRIHSTGVLRVAFRRHSDTHPSVTSTSPNLALNPIPAPTVPTEADWAWAIDSIFTPGDHFDPGIALAPEYFESATYGFSTGYASLNSLAERKDWVALIDPKPSDNTPADLIARRTPLGSPKGHSLMYAPYLRLVGDSSNTPLVAPSSTVAGIFSRSLKTRGLGEPPAGTSLTLRGVIGAEFDYTRQDQDQLNPNGINLIRLIRNSGYLVWGSRTLSTNPLYRFVQTRVAMNVLNNTLRRGFSEFLFRRIDGRGELLYRIGETARNVCSRLYREGALFGESDADAYTVICNFENNPADQLELGNILVEVYARTSPATEKILIMTFRQSLVD